MANELIDEWERKKQKGVVIKLDMEKGFRQGWLDFTKKTFLWQKALAQNG